LNDRRQIERSCRRVMSQGSFSLHRPTPTTTGSSRNRQPRPARHLPAQIAISGIGAYGLPYRFDQRCGNKWLFDILHAASLLSRSPRELAAVGGKEDYRRLISRSRQLSPQVDARHATKVNIEDQAGCVDRTAFSPECFGRAEKPNLETAHLEETPDALEGAGIIINKNYQPAALPLRSAATAAERPGLEQASL